MHTSTILSIVCFFTLGGCSLALGTDELRDFPPNGTDTGPDSNSSDGGIDSGPVDSGIDSGPVDSGTDSGTDSAVGDTGPVCLTPTIEDVLSSADPRGNVQANLTGPACDGDTFLVSYRFGGRAGVEVLLEADGGEESILFWIRQPLFSASFLEVDTDGSGFLPFSLPPTYELAQQQDGDVGDFAVSTSSPTVVDISDEGRVVFSTQASLDPMSDDDEGADDIYLWDLDGSYTHLSTEGGDAVLVEPRISDNGRLVVYMDTQAELARYSFPEGGIDGPVDGSGVGSISFRPGVAALDVASDEDTFIISQAGSTLFRGVFSESQLSVGGPILLVDRSTGVPPPLMPPEPCSPAGSPRLLSVSGPNISYVNPCHFVDTGLSHFEVATTSDTLGNGYFFVSANGADTATGFNEARGLSLLVSRNNGTDPEVWESGVGQDFTSVVGADRDLQYFLLHDDDQGEYMVARDRGTGGARRAFDSVQLVLDRSGDPLPPAPTTGFVGSVAISGNGQWAAFAAEAASAPRVIFGRVRIFVP